MCTKLNHLHLKIQKFSLRAYTVASVMLAQFSDETLQHASVRGNYHGPDFFIFIISIVLNVNYNCNF